jgi:hypothetical protein
MWKKASAVGIVVVRPGAALLRAVHAGVECARAALAKLTKVM